MSENNEAAYHRVRAASARAREARLRERLEGLVKLWERYHICAREPRTILEEEK